MLSCFSWVQLLVTPWTVVGSYRIDSSVHGILQARILEWVAKPSSRGSSQPRDRTCVSYCSCTDFTTSTIWEACLYIWEGSILLYEKRIKAHENGKKKNIGRGGKGAKRIVCWNQGKIVSNGKVISKELSTWMVAKIVLIGFGFWIITDFKKIKKAEGRL